MNGAITNKNMENQLQAFGKINTFVFDVDGVLTNGSVLITEEGDLLRNMYIKDGYALQLAVKSGYRILIITGGKSEGVVSRLKGLGITDVFSNIENKMEVFRSYLQQHGIEQQACLYMGDDIPDLGIMKEVGLAACPADACTDILEIADYISEHPGGRGCVRDVIEKTLKIQGRWEPH